jgi:signal transduction histidine kinase/DNA-binding response OmpR family regulator
MASRLFPTESMSLKNIDLCAQEERCGGVMGPLNKKMMPWLLTAVMLLLMGCHASYSGKISPQAVAGVINLTDWDFTRDGPVKLNGTWLFSWQQLLQPPLPFPPAQEFAAVTVPGTWSNYQVKNQKLPTFGFGTFMLRILLPQGQHEVGIQLGMIMNASRVYANGKLVFAQGKVGRSPDEYQSGVDRRVVKIDTDTPVVDLVVQAANYDLSLSGILDELVIGEAESMVVDAQRTLLIAVLVCGAILVMAFYHLALFALRPADRTTLYFGLCCLFHVGYCLASVWALSLLIPNCPGEIWWKFFFIGWFMSSSFFAVYHAELYPLEFSRRFAVCLVCWAGLASFLLLILPFRMYSPLGRSFLFLNAVTIIYMSFSIVKSLRRGREGARLSLIGLLILSAAVINDILVAHHVIIHSTYLALYGIFAVILVQSFLLSRRFANAFAKVEYLTQNLQREVKKQTLILEEKNQTLADAHEKLKTLDKQKTHFFQNISHELRTPLTLIMNPVEQLMREFGHHKKLQVVQRNTMRLYRLVNQLLDFQKIEAGKKHLDLTPIDMLQFMKVCCDYADSWSRKKEVHIVLAHNGKPLAADGSDGKVYVKGEADALEKILFNYLSNALKFSPAGSTVELGLSADENRVRLYVRDEGPGIATADQAKLFKIFSQVDDTTTREYEGSGIGLALTKELATKMGGTVGVESERHKGALFWAEFPRIPDESHVIDLVCVDDDPSIADFFRLELGRHPLRFEVVHNAKQARKLISNHRVRAIISDQELPLEDGVSLLSFMEKQQPDAIRCMYTGHTEPEFLQKLINLGNLHKIYYKPFSIRAICDDIVALLHKEAAAGSGERSQSNFEVSEWLLEGQTEDQGKNGSNGLGPFADRPTVLVVDDVKDLSNLIVGTLEANQFNTLVAGNGIEGMEMARSGRPDLIITDWMMPKVSGLDLIKMLRDDAECSSLPVVLLTAKSDETSKKLAIQAGADSFLSKPFDELELLSTVNNLLRLKSGEKKIAEHAKAIKTILDNVKSGFFLIDREFRIKPGFSKSCQLLLDLDIKEQSLFLDAFELSPRSREGFEASLEQVFADVFPEKAALANLPTRVAKNSRIYSLEGSVVRDEFGQIAAILFTVNDITQLAAIETEHMQLQSLLCILNCKEAFRFFVTDSLQRLEGAKKQLENGKHSIVGQSLHTVKGNASLFELTETVNLINAIEEKKSFDQADIDAVYAALRGFIEANEKILGMDLRTINETVLGVTQSQLDKLGEVILATQSAGKIAEYFRQWYLAVSSVPVAIILGPIERSVLMMAKKLGKQINFTVRGGDLPVVPHLYSDIFHDLIHLIRNALDHGIEPAFERGAKSPVGNVMLAFSCQGKQIEIIVEDDGRGIDTRKVLQKAKTCGLIDDKSAANLSDSQITDLIFLEKVSTVQDAQLGISGRGVGMGAIKAAVDKAHGSLTVASERGRGTRVTITLPYQRLVPYPVATKKAS